MTGPTVERRRFKRREGTFSVSLRTTGAITLTGKAVNFNEHSVLLHAHGQLSVIVTFRDQIHLGRLVRATAVDGATTYAIELEELGMGG